MGETEEHRERIERILGKVGIEGRMPCSCGHRADEHVVWDANGHPVEVGRCFACACEEFRKA